MRDMSIFVLVGRDPDFDPMYPDAEVRRLVYVTYGRNGGAMCKSWFDDERYGRASGGGYDITAEAVMQAVAGLYRIPAVDGARGMSSVVAHCRAHGVVVANTTDILYSVESVAQETKRKAVEQAYAEFEVDDPNVGWIKVVRTPIGQQA